MTDYTTRKRADYRRGERRKQARRKRARQGDRPRRDERLGHAWYGGLAQRGSSGLDIRRKPDEEA